MYEGNPSIKTSDMGAVHLPDYLAHNPGLVGDLAMEFAKRAGSPMPEGSDVRVAVNYWRQEMLKTWAIGRLATNPDSLPYQIMLGLEGTNIHVPFRLPETSD